MAQMARVGFRTVGSCRGHQVTTAQLAVLPGQRRELGCGGGGEKLLGWNGGLQGIKRCWRCCGCLLSQAGLYLLPLSPNWKMLYPARKDAVGFGELNLSRGPGWPPPPSPEQDLLPDAGPQPCLPPWWRVPTCLALRAAACRTATRSTCGSHTSFVCQHPHALCPLEALLPRPAGLSSPPGPSVPGLAWPGRGRDDKHTPPTSALSSSTAVWPGHRVTPNAWPPSATPQTWPKCPAQPPAQALRYLGKGLRLLCGGRGGRRCDDRRQGWSFRKPQRACPGLGLGLL